MIDYNVWEIKITFNGSSYTVKEPKELENVEKGRAVLCFFKKMDIYAGFTDGKIDNKGNFCLSNKNKTLWQIINIDELLGWAYFDEDRT